MPTRKKPETAETTIEIPQPTRVGMDICLVGTSSYLCNRMSEKAKRELLLPSGRKTAATKATTLKHDPFKEFQDSAYMLPEGEPTLLAIMASAPKRACAAAALDVPGAAKAQIGRLVWSTPQYSQYISIWGIPELYMAVTRMADANRTPDVRTFAILPRWAVRLNLSYLAPQLTDTAVINLLATAGYTIGLGDGRPEKGKLDYGQFRIAASDDPEFIEIVKSGGRAAQMAAMKAVVPHDEETQDLLSWFSDEAKRRGRATSRTNGANAEAAMAT